MATHAAVPLVRANACGTQCVATRALIFTKSTGIKEADIGTIQQATEINRKRFHAIAILGSKNCHFFKHVPVVFFESS